MCVVSERQLRRFANGYGASCGSKVFNESSVIPCASCLLADCEDDVFSMIERVVEDSEEELSMVAAASSRSSAPALTANVGCRTSSVFASNLNTTLSPFSNTFTNADLTGIVDGPASVLVDDGGAHETRCSPAGTNFVPENRRVM